MNHDMKINPDAFNGVKKGLQKFETRLYDEKRRKIRIGDTITFYKLPQLDEMIKVEVTDIIKTNNFEMLFTMFNPRDANWPSNYTTKDCAVAMQKYYSIQNQEKWGVVAFKIKLIEK